MHFTVPPLDEGAAEAARARQAELTKPRGSLGELEQLAVRLAAMQGQARPAARPAAAILIAADHPVAARGVSAYPQEVTAAMLANFVRGGAAASVLARRLEVRLDVVDVGVRHPYAAPAEAAGVRCHRDPVAGDAAGDLAVEDAMSEATFARAVAAGRAAVDRLPDPLRVLVLGEMGIANSTCAAAVAAALLDAPAETMTGPGTGVAGDALVAKLAVVGAAAARVRGAAPERVLRAVGGRELAALVGAAGRAIERRAAVLVDGFIVSAAMLALVRAVPRAADYLIFAHRSAEPGHRLVLDALGARPLLDLGLRLGEGSGALAALPLLDAACALHDGMATFAEAAVPDRPGGAG